MTKIIDWTGGAKVIRDMRPDEMPLEKSAAELLDNWRETATASPANIRLILHRTGALAAIEGAIADNPEAKILFEYATEIRRNAAMILQLSTSAGFSPVQVDALFQAAIALETTP
jgi:hypothetical protein